MGPFTTGTKGEFVVDHTDEAVRGALVLDNGTLTWPAPPPKVTLLCTSARFIQGELIWVWSRQLQDFRFGWPSRTEVLVPTAIHAACSSGSSKETGSFRGTTQSVPSYFKGDDD